MTYQPPPSYYPPQQWPPPQPPKKKTPRFVIALIAVCALALAVLALHESGGESDTTPRSTTSRATEGTADATSTPEPSAAAQPRDTLRFEDGLTATITNISTGISTNSAEQDGPLQSSKSSCETPARRLLTPRTGGPPTSTTGHRDWPLRI